MIIYLIVGALFGGLGLILWIVKGKKEGKSASLELMDTSRIKDVVQNYTEMNASMGDGSFSLHCEVKGKAHSDTPIESDLSKEQVVYFSSKIVHEYEKQVTKKNSKGEKETKWVKYKDTVSENKRWANDFGVKDDTGFIAVNANNSKFHTEKLFSNFEKGEPNQNSGGINISIKGFSLGIGGGKNKGIRTIGYRYTETGIRNGTDLYVVGDANDRDGKLEISKPKDKNDQFIVSVKSKDEFIGSIGSAVKGLTIGAIVSWVAAAAIIVYGIVN